MAAQHVASAATDSSFARYGITDVAYMRTVMLEGRVAYAVHAADGTCPTPTIESTGADTTQRSICQQRLRLGSGAGSATAATK